MESNRYWSRCRFLRWTSRRGGGVCGRSRSARCSWRGATRRRRRVAILRYTSVGGSVAGQWRAADVNVAAVCAKNRFHRWTYVSSRGRSWAWNWCRADTWCKRAAADGAESTGFGYTRKKCAGFETSRVWIWKERWKKMLLGEGNSTFFRKRFV